MSNKKYVVKELEVTVQLLCSVKVNIYEDDATSILADPRTHASTVAVKQVKASMKRAGVLGQFSGVEARKVEVLRINKRNRPEDYSVKRLPADFSAKTVEEAIAKLRKLEPRILDNERFRHMGSEGDSTGQSLRGEVIVHLRDKEGFTFKEVGNVLGLSMTTVANRYHRHHQAVLRQKVRQLFSEPDPLGRPISELGFSPTAEKTLLQNGASTLADLVAKPADVYDNGVSQLSDKLHPKSGHNHQHDDWMVYHVISLVTRRATAIRDAAKAAHLGKVSGAALPSTKAQQARNIPLSDVLSSRSLHCFSQLDHTGHLAVGTEVRVVSDLTRFSEHELLKLRNFGRRSLREVKEVLATFDLSLKSK